MGNTLSMRTKAASRWTWNQYGFVIYIFELNGQINTRLFPKTYMLYTIWTRDRPLQLDELCFFFIRQCQNIDGHFKSHEPKAYT